MTAPASRRGFLRGLTTLPLIGGGVALLGAPSAVAEIVTDRLLGEYHDWLMYERRLVATEITGDTSGEPDALYGSALRWHRLYMPTGPAPTPPSTRAALVLSTVGVEWRQGKPCA